MSRKVAAAVGGGSMLVGGVALAVFLGLAAVNDNNVQTGELPPPAVLAVALLPAATGTCDDAALVYEEVSSGAVFSGETLDYSRISDNVVAGAPIDVCVRNETNGTLPVGFVMAGAQSDELGGICDVFETDAGDVTCGAGEGELAGGELLFRQSVVITDSQPGVTGACLDHTMPIIPGIGGGEAVAVLEPGGWCRYASEIVDDRIDPSISSTDDVTFHFQYQADDSWALP